MVNTRGRTGIIRFSPRLTNRCCSTAFSACSYLFSFIFFSSSAQCSLIARNPYLDSFPAYLFSGLRKLTALKLYENTFTSIPPGAFKDLPQLAYLSLQRNDITAVLDGFWPHGELPLLRTLLFDQNQISRVDPDAFIGASSAAPSRLRLLDLSYNQISTALDSSAFVKDLRSLTKLSVQFNALSRIGPSAFAGFEQLRHLTLDHNRISTIGAGAFAGVGSRLNQIKLDDNPLRNIDGAALADMVNQSGNTKAKILFSIDTTSTPCPVPNPTTTAKVRCTGAPCQLPYPRDQDGDRVDYTAPRCNCSGVIAEQEALLGAGVEVAPQSRTFVSKSLSKSPYWHRLSVKAGSNFSDYECGEGLEPNGGDSSRTCDPSGSGRFLGTPLVCSQAAAAPADVAPSLCDADLNASCGVATACYGDAACSAAGERLWSGPFLTCERNGAEVCAPCFPSSPCGVIAPPATASAPSPSPS